MMQAVPAIQDARSVHKSLRLVGFEPAGLGWDVLLVMQAVTVIQDARSVHKPLRLVGFEPVGGLGWDVLPVEHVVPAIQNAQSGATGGRTTWRRFCLPLTIVL